MFKNTFDIYFIYPLGFLFLIVLFVVFNTRQQRGLKNWVFLTCSFLAWFSLTLIGNNIFISNVNFFVIRGFDISRGIFGLFLSTAIYVVILLVPTNWLLTWLKYRGRLILIAMGCGVIGTLFQFSNPNWITAVFGVLFFSIAVALSMSMLLTHVERFGQKFHPLLSVLTMIGLIIMATFGAVTTQLLIRQNQIGPLTNTERQIQASVALGVFLLAGAGFFWLSKHLQVQEATFDLNQVSLLKPFRINVYYFLIVFILLIVFSKYLAVNQINDFWLGQKTYQNGGSTAEGIKAIRMQHQLFLMFRVVGGLGAGVILIPRIQFKATLNLALGLLCIFFCIEAFNHSITGDILASMLGGFAYSQITALGFCLAVMWRYRTKRKIHFTIFMIGFITAQFIPTFVFLMCNYYQIGVFATKVPTAIFTSNAKALLDLQHIITILGTTGGVICLLAIAGLFVSSRLMLAEYRDLKGLIQPRIKELLAAEISDANSL